MSCFSPALLPTILLRVAVNLVVTIETREGLTFLLFPRSFMSQSAVVAAEFANKMYDAIFTHSLPFDRCMSCRLLFFQSPA
jgi:hypothetical protein